MELTQPKVFEKPDAGMFLGTIGDVVDMPNVSSTYNGVTKLVNKIRVLWFLGTLDGRPVLDSEGKPMTVAEFFNAVMADNSNLSKRMVQILSSQPPLMTKTEEVAALLIGRSAQLFLVKAPNKKNPADPYTNVSGAAPLSPGQIAPKIPADFVREINRPKTVAGVQTYATPAVAAQASQAEQFAAWQAAQRLAAAQQPQTPAQQTGNAPAATPPPAPAPTAPPAPIPGAPVPPNNVSF